MAENQKNVDYDPSRFNSLPVYFKAIFAIFTVVGIATAAIYMTNTTVFGFALPSGVYFYILFMMFLPCAYLVMPARKADKGRIPWYDLVAALTAFVIPIYFIRWNYEIVWIGWLPAPTVSAIVIAVIYSILILECCRRIGGPVFFGLSIAIGLYPLVAEYMPGILYGMGHSFVDIISYAIYGGEGIIGLPGKLTGGILIGFLIFAGMLIGTGAGDFFLDLANALMGRYRGGPAKVAVISSGFFGSLSGSPISNIISTGSVTIPAMKKIGYPKRYAGAIEACASTGGVLMPPVMGMIVFVMAVITEFAYADIMVAAIIPAGLFYFGLIIQVDLHAARLNFSGVPREEIPSFWKTMKEGWQFIFVLVFLVWGLLYMRWAEVTPYYASVVLFVLSFVNKKTMMTPTRTYNTIIIIGKLVAQMVSLILPFAFILCGLVITGTSASFAAGLVNLGGGNLYLILLMGILACYLLGIVGFDIAAYVFLAISLAPALEQLGLNKMAVHLFLVYYPMLAVLTPPVAIGAFVAAAMAGGKPMQTAWTAMRLGVVIYFIPLFFVFEPSLVMQGPWTSTVYYTALVLIGTTILAGGLTGFFYGMGPINSAWKRWLLGLSGLAITVPETMSSVIGGIVAVLVFILIYFTREKESLVAAEISEKVSA